MFYGNFADCDSAGLMYERAYRDCEYRLGPDNPRTLEFKRKLDEFRMKMENSEMERSEMKEFEPEESEPHDEWDHQ